MEPSSLTGIVLAGGRSQRMGHDKALLPWQGMPLVVWVLQRVTALCGRRLLVGGSPEVAEIVRQWDPGVEQVPDHRAGEGPLNGLESGLTASRTDANLLLTCDLPYLNPKLLVYLLEQWQPACFDAVVPHVEGHWQTGQALYHRRVIHRARELLAGGERSLRSLLARLSVKVITGEELQARGLDLGSFLNVNRPEDWRRLHDNFVSP